MASRNEHLRSIKDRKAMDELFQLIETHSDDKGLRSLAKDYAKRYGRDGKEHEQKAIFDSTNPEQIIAAAGNNCENTYVEAARQVRADYDAIYAKQKAQSRAAQRLTRPAAN